MHFTPFPGRYFSQREIFCKQRGKSAGNFSQLLDVGEDPQKTGKKYFANGRPQPANLAERRPQPRLPGGRALWHPPPWSRLPRCSGWLQPTPCPLPRPYSKGIFYLAGAGGGYYSIISFQRGATFVSPFVNPPKCCPLSQRCALPALPKGEPSFSCRAGKFRGAHPPGLACHVALVGFSPPPAPSRKDSLDIVCPLAVREGEYNLYSHSKGGSIHSPL